MGASDMVVMHYPEGPAIAPSGKTPKASLSATISSVLLTWRTQSGRIKCIGRCSLYQSASRRKGPNS